MADASMRLLNLLSLLQTPREWPGGELAQRLAVSGRTVRRDIERLRELGYPVEATKGPDGGYRLVAGTAMPPLLLDDEEAVAITVGLRTATGHPVDGIGEVSARALAKLEQVLPSRLRHRVASLGAATVPLSWLGAEATTVDPAHLATFAAAVANRERVRFTYLSGDGTPTRRLAEPHHIVPTGRRWYLIAYDVDRDDWRTFRVDRIVDPHPTGQRRTPRAVPGGDAAAFLKRQLLSLAPTYRAEVTVHLPADQVIARLGAASEDVRPLDDGRCHLRHRADTLEWLAARLLMLGCEFEVHDPPELRTHLRGLAARATAAARGR
ncbi:helix-turn-helix transcriptional regulator [Actinomadura macra]|uniref:helix-turn-helix transcriptional regulator n=1 Tax=Actinomadura macra TaxID=46164 RepID=UPI000830B259|nr:YafY family protein [Actinomadura macra]